MLRLARDGLCLARLTSRLGATALLSLLVAACGGAQPTARARHIEAGGPSSRIEERSLSDRPPLAVIERKGDPEAAVAFASLASAAPELHAALGEVLKERLSKAGFQTQLVAHGLGFELMLLAESPERARAATQALLQALAQPIAAADVATTAGAAAKEPAKTPTSAVALCSAELSSRRRISDPSELDRDRVATFARDRSAWAVVGDDAATSAVVHALSAGPDWPELGRVRSTLPEASVTQVQRGEHGALSVAITVGDANRALDAAARLGQSKSALDVRLAALGAGLRLRRVAATAHPLGACLRMDSDIDATPLPEARRLGFAIALMEEEAALALGQAGAENRLENSAVSASDPRAAARAAAYGALVETADKLASARLVALTTPDEPPLVPSIDAAAEQARTEALPLEVQLRIETGQPGMWALVSTPCAAMSEHADGAGNAAVLLGAAALAPAVGARLEPWVGSDGVGLLGFVERAPGETDAEAAARLGNALGQALLAPPSALDIATARTELLKAAGTEPHPLLDALLDTLAPGHFGALAPRGSVTSLQAASREAALARQRELLRLPHRIALLSPTNAVDAGGFTRSLSRWLKTPDSVRPSPCESEVTPPARSELSLSAGSDSREGAYVAFRIPAKAGAEASVLADLLNQPGGALTRALADPELVGAARALVFGTSSARALIVQVSAFEGREPEAISRIQKLFERLATGGVLAANEIEGALARQRTSRRLAALDPRYRLVQLLEPAPAPVDAVGLRRLAASLRPEAAVIARSAPRSVPASSGKTPALR